MKRDSLRHTCLTLVMAVALGCDSDRTPVAPDVSEPQIAAIQGVVSIGNSPVGGAWVSLSGPSGTRATTSDPDGAFAFPALIPGVYTVAATFAGVACDSATTEVEAGETITASIGCAAAQAQGVGTITGAVTARDAPLGGARVALAGLPFTGALAERAVTADPTGHFTFAGLTSGTYTVTAMAAGFSCTSPVSHLPAGQTVTLDISCAATGDDGVPSLPPMVSGGKIAFERDGRIMVIDPDGSSAALLIEGRAPSWSPDGTRLVFQRPACLDWSLPPYSHCDDIWMVHADGSGLAPITNSEFVHDHEPAWSPDGTKVAFIRLWHGPDQDYLVVVDVDQPQALWSETVPSQWWPYARPTWSADGTRIAFTCQGPSPSWEFDICTVPSDGNVGYFTNSTPNWSTGLVKLTNDTWTNSDPAWSPDGARIAFATNRDAGGQPHIALIRPDGSGFARLVPGRSPAWSPDGTRIVFAGGADAPGLHVMNADGSGLVRITHDPEDTAPSWGR